MNITKKPVLISMIILLILANFALLYKVYHIEKLANSDSIPDSERKNMFLKEYFKEKVILQFNFENTQIDNNLSLLTPGGDTILSANIFTGTDKLIFYYPRNSCEPCIDLIITQIKDNADRIGHKNITIISEYSNIRAQILFIRMNGLTEMNVFSLLSKEFVIPEAEYNIPYLFVTDSTLKTKYFFIPDKSYPKLSKSYFDILAKKVFSAN